ncbi:dethiobiotin synthase [Mucilaginibacter gotjawali]|uniref:ATP-dependent dethiobiotin synthetase BioD n=2 Tax=Mucilaginibacter gotjawali TaxID=1550579 RepID=A0A0X8X3M4_9SPHI|nr:dethiobiotin synthase [Mucilaginibacter gotjawali]MBB3055694.1 dethiobiotin synthetase [Mucilaginibacter gotjawali]BAU54513.1 ATP-dependent dethiobiotin synthetase BioD 1 [Mucilaginibacter gotjawali]
MNNRPIFVTGIGTGIGKTIVSAALVEKLKADYWKPVQSGDLENSDTITVKNLISNSKTVFFEEAYRLTQPFSPHKSAAIDGISIKPENIGLPATSNTLVIEGAGGLMVPLNTDFLMIDLIRQLGAAVILVSQNYLGSINHTLLSAYALKKENIPVRGIIFNGVKDIYSKDFILENTGFELLGHIPAYDILDKKAIIDAGLFINGL